jgi:hypothetical protein
VDERFRITEEMADDFLDSRLSPRISHSRLQLIRQRICPMAVDYRDRNDNGFLRVDTALLLSFSINPGRRWQGLPSRNGRVYVRLHE